MFRPKKGSDFNFEKRCKSLRASLGCGWEISWHPMLWPWKAMLCGQGVFKKKPNTSAQLTQYFFFDEVFSLLSDSNSTSTRIVSEVTTPQRTLVDFQTFSLYWNNFAHSFTLNYKWEDSPYIASKNSLFCTGVRPFSQKM